MKRMSRSSVVVLLVVLSLVLPPMAMAAPLRAAEWTYVVEAPLGLRLRSEASLLSEIVLVLYNGEDVRVEGDPVYADGLWWSAVRVERRAGEFSGWVASAYLANYEPQVAPEGEEGTQVYTVSPRLGLNLRESPGLATRVVCIVPQGTRLSATDAPTRSVDGLWWRQFTLGETTVWAAENLLEAPPSE